MRRLLAAWAVAGWLAGCAVFAPAPVMAPAPPFDVFGRVLASHEGRAFSSGFRWRHEGPADEIWLLTPLGQTLATISAGADGALLTGADGQETRAASVESLTRRALGWPLPLLPLQYWIRGAAAPGAADALRRDALGRPEQLQQHGWQVRYTYAESGDGRMPRRVELTQDGQQIRMVIDEWRTPAP